MSVGASVAAPPRAARAVPVALGLLAVGAQVVYPLTPAGAPRHQLTVATVLVFFAASASHALVWRGAGFVARLTAITAGGGFLAEVVGVSTGLPFGAYAYTDTLGAALLGVPLVIPLAWTMMAYPAYAVARRVTGKALPGALLAGWALASWDLFLDPQMVDAGHWVWEGGGPALVGVPVTNFLGWLLVATVMMAVLWRAEPSAAPVTAADDRVLYGLYLWTYGSSVLAHAVFFGLPASALAGGLCMGVVVAAWLAAVRT